MGTTTKTEPTTGRSRARGSDPEMELDEEREQQFDLLTAALIGAAIGAGITLLVRRGPSGNRPVGPLVLLNRARLGGRTRPSGEGYLSLQRALAADATAAMRPLRSHPGCACRASTARHARREAIQSP